MYSAPVFVNPLHIAHCLFWPLALAILWYSIPRAPTGFRESRDVPRIERFSVATRWKDKMIAYWEEHNSSCGVIAPNVKGYDSYMLMKRGETVDEIFNLRVLPIPDAGHFTIEEFSPLCPDPEKGRLVDRLAKVLIMHDTLFEDSKTLTIDNLPDAVCLQHFYDIFKGEWPCVEPAQP